VRFIVLTAAFLCAFAGPVLAWGPEGHSIIAEIAQRRLTKEAADAIARILDPQNSHAPYALPSLSSAANWADDVRYPGGSHPESYNWHFVDMPLDAAQYDPVRDCTEDPQKRQGDCVVAELNRLKNDLRCTTGIKQLEALKFAVHFVGDIHQPLHTVLEKQGANLIEVHVLFGGKICDGVTCFIQDEWQNLHYVWDVTIITKTFYNWGAYVDYLESGWLTSQEAKDDSKDDPVVWANDTHALAQQVWMNDGASLFNDDYFKANKIVDRQLGLAGLRLARFLNRAFSSSQCPVP